MILLLLACIAPSGDGPGPKRQDAPAAGDTADTRDTGDSAGDSAGESAADTAPVDADGDGWTVAGGDCDDTRADVHPGAEEWCDPVDHDCDGEPLAEGVCGKEQDADRIVDATWVGDVAGDEIGRPLPAGDFDADGIDDFLVWGGAASRFTEGASTGTVYAVLGGGPLGRDLPLFDAAAAYWAGEPEQHDWPLPPFAAGDFDGDGFDDFWVPAVGCWPDDGSAYLILGPPERWPTDGAYLVDAADGWWTEANDSECFAWCGAGGADLDGDGLDDAVLVTVGADWDAGAAAYTFIAGRAVPAFGAARTDEVTIPVSSRAGAAAGAGSVTFTGDLDGDGLSEVSYQQSGGHALVSGVEFAEADGVGSGELGVALEDWSSSLYAPLGDWDGDGADDLVLAGDDDYTDGVNARIRILRAPDLNVSTTHANSLEIGSFHGDEVDANVGGAVQIVPDMDGDGRSEITGYQMMENGFQVGICVFPSTRFVAAPQSAREVAWCHTSAERTFYDMPGGDFDGDGLTDLLFGAGNQAEDRGRVYLLRGWELPWADPYYW